MRKNLLLRLCLILSVVLSAYSCRTDQFPENETYSNSSKFQLTSKRISLSESKHKSVLVQELEKAEAAFKNSKTNVNGRLIDYGNGVSIDTDDVIYIENGPNYYTYTFHIKRENAPAGAPLENLLLVPLPDGKYNEFLITYNLTLAEKESLKAGLPVNTNGKSQVTKLANGSFNSGGQLARLSCTEVSETIWVECSQHVHNKTNVEDWINCKATTGPSVYTLVTMNCIEENDDIITPIDPGGSSGGGGGGTMPGGTTPPNNPPCTGTTIPTNPQPGFTDENGCPIGAPSLPNFPVRNNPCEKIKVQRTDTEFNNKITDLEGKTNLKKETGYIQKWGGDYVYKDNAGSTNNANTLSLPSVETNTYIKGFIHTHVNNYKFLDDQGYETDKNGIKMFSPADIAYFMNLVKNAKETGQPLNDVYGIMVSSVGNYQIRFTGNEYQIKTFTDVQKEAHRKPFEDFMTRNGIKNATDLEFGMLKYMDEKMNLKGLSLYRMNNDGTNSEIKLNETKNGLERNNCPS